VITFCHKFKRYKTGDGLISITVVNKDKLKESGAIEIGKILRRILIWAQVLFIEYTITERINVLELKKLKKFQRYKY